MTSRIASFLSILSTSVFTVFLKGERDLSRVFTLYCDRALAPVVMLEGYPLGRVMLSMIYMPQFLSLPYARSLCSVRLLCNCCPKSSVAQCW